MPNYQNGKIYCIRSHQTEDVYIGSTVQQLLCMRFGDHRKHFKKWKNDMYTYTSSYEIIKYEDAYIELLEEYPCNSREELYKKEGEYIRKMRCVNKQIAGRSKKDYATDNKEYLDKKAKEYRNRPEIKKKIDEKAKEYRDNVDNKEKIKEYQGEYRNNPENKQKQKERFNIYIKCDICNCEISKYRKKRHEKTQKHINNLTPKEHHTVI